jgi:methionine biosynthesis protein MetW
VNKNSAIKFICESISSESKVLEVGCGDGGLLRILNKKKNTKNKGLEINPDLVIKALEKGVSVIHGDANNDLTFYPDNSFDYVVLRGLLQATNNPKEVLREIFRISKYAIVEIPNFAYLKNRIYLGLKGKMPVNKFLPYQWHDTPNIHFCSIGDFLHLCQEDNVEVSKKAFFAKGKKINPILSLMPNLMAQYVIFVLTKTT